MSRNVNLQYKLLKNMVIFHNKEWSFWTETLDALMKLNVCIWPSTCPITYLTQSHL